MSHELLSNFRVHKVKLTLSKNNTRGLQSTVGYLVGYAHSLLPGQAAAVISRKQNTKNISQIKFVSDVIPEVPNINSRSGVFPESFITNSRSDVYSLKGCYN